MKINKRKFIPGVDRLEKKISLSSFAFAPDDLPPPDPEPDPGPFPDDDLPIFYKDLNNENSTVR